jgi:hypothetical protein
LDPELVVAFLAAMKINESTGQVISYTHIQKFNDAIKFGCKKTNLLLPRGYNARVETFLNEYKNECGSARKKGIKDDHEADPMCFDLYKMICNWAVLDDDLMCWVYQVLCGSVLVGQQMWKYWACTI